MKLLASEPNLKVKHKLKKHLNTRKSPLTRKESAPPTVKHRVSDTLGKHTLNQMKRIVGQFLFSLSVMSLVLFLSNECTHLRSCFFCVQTPPPAAAAPLSLDVVHLTTAWPVTTACCHLQVASHMRLTDMHTHTYAMTKQLTQFPFSK